MRIDRRVVVPALAALSVTALGVSVSFLGGGSSGPRPLALASGGREADALGAPTASGAESGYTLVGTLPSGRPDDAPAWSLPSGPASAELVAALARALDAGTPVRDGSSWRAGGLTVVGDPGQAWWFSLCATDTPVTSDMPTDARGSSCGIAVPGGTVSGGSGGSGSGSSGSSGSGTASSGVATAAPPPVSPDASPPVPRATPVPAPDETAVPSSPVPGAPAPAPTGSPVPESTVTAAARPVLEALGLSLSDAVVETHPYGGSVTVRTEVGSVEAQGYATRVDVSADGTVSNAQGWLADPDRGDDYPLITAQDAYDALPPRMVAMLCPISPDGKGCLPPEPTEVTGAQLGLSLQQLRAGGQLLVPSWLFSLKGSSELVPVVAVQPEYLDTGEEPAPTDKPGASTEPDPGTEPGTEPGTGTGGSPGQVDPVGPREAFSFHQAFRGEKPNSVVVQYGNSSSCPRQGVQPLVKESGDQVVVFLEADPMRPGIACTDDYRPVELVVPLSAALGDRTVIDGASGKPVPVTTR